MELTQKQVWTSLRERPEHGADAMPTSDSEYLRALTQHSEVALARGPLSSSAPVVNPAQEPGSTGYQRAWRLHDFLIFLVEVATAAAGGTGIAASRPTL